jgi:dipeptidyl aminopeptidase/acylaminoacyl peptidase
MAKSSPVHVVDRIKAPLPLAHGGVDRRVLLDHGKKMRDALRKAGREPEWVVCENEGHGRLLPETNQDFGSSVEKFLAREPAMPPAPR